MNKCFLFCLVTLVLACGSPDQNNKLWMQDEISAYLKNSTHPITTLHLGGKTEQLWFKTDNVQIQNISCSAFQLDLVSKHDDQMPGRILASTLLAFDTITHQKFEMDYESGEFMAYK